MKFFILILSHVFLQSCGSGSIGNQLDQNKLNDVFSTSNAPEGMVTLYIYREARAATAYGVMRVLIDGVKVHEIGNGSFTKIYIKPGKHQFYLKFYEDDSMAQTIDSKSPMTADKTWLLATDYFGKNKRLLPMPMESIKAILTDQYYQEPLQESVQTISVTNEDRDLWRDFVSKNSVTAMDNFLYLYPYSPFAKDAKKRKEDLIKKESKDYSTAKKSQGPKKILSYLSEYPQAHNKKDALKEAIRRSSSANQMSEIFKMFPESSALMPAKYQLEFELMAIGPSSMKIENIYELLKKEGLPPGIVSAKILANAGLYKDFTSNEVRYLQQKGIPSQVIESMILSTTKAQDEIKNAQKDDAMMKQIKELIENSNQKVSAQDIKNDGGNSTIECIKQKTALEACARTTSGFIKMACDAAARSSFECSTN
ncbi:MAG: hypothetical protein COW01_00265 [Bdellovibrionales bacterium CG12_big_fil_rev_8_21_14_0_65_38_15]|nr:MAG: hypothetical protein COW79_14155 [Bdellovibrionales bacterium CG22_combo_CG10-13_8_21_14_all_38_13]PIQ57403.1 MAG: hypothetical protein COW01_00265 [Bdellovibrionales bacterium CG12_big_fil_rev_8_21_14_0_65_38_15]PIR31123.1 MAG: hypothetical protein COV38_01745 [Bdellovibrionales bacterium CG11_big_fil_rev_8_21_14_0_20_38_13]